MMANKADSTCENLGLSLSNTNSDKAQAQQQLIPQVFDPLTPHSSDWDFNTQLLYSKCYLRRVNYSPFKGIIHINKIGFLHL